jgi:site-specific recombinase XerC
MNEFAVVERATEWQRMKSLVLDSVSSPITKRVYNMALDEFFAWYAQEPRPGFSKATVSAWRVTLEERGLGSSSIIVRMSAIRKLAVEATDNGLLAPELAAGIQRVKSAKSIGVRAGNWLSLKQAQTLLNAPDIATLKGLRDRAIIAVLLGCALRRSEVAALTMGHVQQRDGRWCIVDLVGKHGRVRDRLKVFDSDGSVRKDYVDRLDPECIEALDFNLSAGRHKPFTFDPGEHRQPAELIGELDAIHAEIRERLGRLLQLVEGR